MAGVKISALPAVAAPQLTDIFAIVQAGVTFKETVGQLATLMSTTLSGTFVPLAGGVMTGPLILSGDPTLPLGAATKQYVDAIASGFTVILACRVATTANLTATYANGAAGIGATLTNSGAMVALSIDGVALVLNDRVLVKNQTSTFQNGVYQVTDVGSGATNWILTRTTDYDEAPTEIHPGTLVSINQGTVNSTTSWLETATVTTIGVDPILFSQFTFNPASFLLKTNNLSDVASIPASLVNLGLGVPVGTGNVVLQTSPTLITPNLGVATATSLAFSPTTNGIIGTTTNDNAIAGRVGEFISSSILQAAGINIPNNVATNLTSIALTAGDWDVYGNISYNAAVGNPITDTYAWISTTSATVPDVSLIAGFNDSIVGSTVRYIPAPYVRMSLSGITTVYLTGFTRFASSTVKMSGNIYARRAR